MAYSSLWSLLSSVMLGHLGGAAAPPEVAGAALSPPPAVQDISPLQAGIEMSVPKAGNGPAVKYTNIPSAYLDTNLAIDRVAAVISSNEGEPTSIDWNDNGQGVSVGLFQANQRVGELPDLLYRLTKMPGGTEELASALGDETTQKITSDPESVRSMSFTPGNELGQGLKTLVKSSLFTKLQVNLLRRKVAKAACVAANYGIRSTAGVAVCADLTNQWGAGGAQRFLQAALTMRSEGGKARAIVNAVAKYSRYGSRYQDDLTKVQGNLLSFDTAFDAEQELAQAEQNQAAQEQDMAESTSRPDS